MDGSYYSACDRYLSYPPMVRRSPRPQTVFNDANLLRFFMLLCVLSGSSVRLLGGFGNPASQHVRQRRDESYERVAQQHVEPTK